MIRITQVFILALSLAVAPAVYAGPSKKIDPRPASQDLITVENALAGSDLVGLFYLDMDYLVRLERSLHEGEEDPFALPTSTGKDDPLTNSFLGFLGQSGLRVSESVDTIIGGFLDGNKDGEDNGQVQVALGDFPVEALTRKWKQNPYVKETKVNGRTAWLWSGVDVETCKPSAPELMIVENRRLIVGDPEAVTGLLKRLDRAKPEKDLGKWRQYRQGKLFAFAVLLPKNMENVSQNMMARMLAHSAREQMDPVTGIYGGGTFTRKPEGIDLELLLESENAAWNREKRKIFVEWKKKTAKKIGPEFKTVKNLLNYLDLQATDNHVVLQAKINEALIKDFGKVFQEGIDLFTSSISSSISISGSNSHSAEKIVPNGDINHYRNLPGPDDLDPFDRTANPDEIYSATSGPFGIRIKGVSINPAKAGAVDLDLEVVSSPIPKLDINPLSQPGEGIGAWLRITHVFDKKGRELLMDDHCGKDRNSKMVTLTKGFRSIQTAQVKKTRTIQKLIAEKSGWSSITLDVFKGSKTVHLKPETLMTDIARVEGEIILQLPAKVTRKRIRAPFKNQVVQTDDIRIKMKEGKSDSISFTASGKVGRLLETRALNGSGQYLQSASSSSSTLFFGRGMDKNQSFQGTPKTAEFVLAGEVSQKTYPFKFKFRRPAYPASPYWKPVEVSTLSRKAFLKMKRSKPKREVCSNHYLEYQTGPFYFCLSENMHLQNKWKQPGKYASGTFLIHTHDTAAITDNLSATQIVIDQVIAAKGKQARKQTFPVKEEQFLTMNSNYAPPLKGTQAYMQAGPVGQGDENLTLMGFRGHLKIRLPRKLNSFRLDLFELGSTARASNGLQVKFTGIDENGVRLEIKGPRETLVHFTPLNLSGRPLSQSEPGVKKIHSQGAPVWQARVKVPPETRYMDIVYATHQDTWTIPFHMEK